MNKLMFLTGQRKIIKFIIKDRKIFYYDDIWKDGIQIMPKDEELINELIKSDKQNLKIMAALILDSNQGESLEEYNKCKTDVDLAKMVRKDAKSKGLMEIK
jgi:hypothetical protein